MKEKKSHEEKEEWKIRCYDPSQMLTIFPLLQKYEVSYDNPEITQQDPLSRSVLKM